MYALTDREHVVQLQQQQQPPEAQHPQCVKYECCSQQAAQEARKNSQIWYTPPQHQVPPLCPYFGPKSSDGKSQKNCGNKQQEQQQQQKNIPPQEWRLLITSEQNNLLRDDKTGCKHPPMDFIGLARQLLLLPANISIHQWVLQPMSSHLVCILIWLDFPLFERKGCFEWQ